jgi:hypothetical protein
MTALDEGRALAPPAVAEAGGSSRRRGLLRRLSRNEVIRFAAGGLLAACLVGAGTFVVVSRDAEDQAIRHAKDITQVEARGIVEPALTNVMLTDAQAAWDAMDTVCKQRILGGDVVRVKLWRADGTILYSDQDKLV